MIRNLSVKSIEKSFKAPLRSGVFAICFNVFYRPVKCEISAKDGMMLPLCESAYGTKEP